MKSFSSSTREIPPAGKIPRHIAVIMDGNGRWAKKRYLPRVAGHKQGVETVRRVTRACGERGVEYLTLFAFSSENWRRPAQEVSTLKQLFIAALEQEAERLHRNKVRLKIIGDIAPFGARVVELARRAQDLTSANSGLTLTIAANYGGRWDLMQALAKLVRSGPMPEGGFTEEQVASQLALNYAPEPDLFIRTGGEQRISNFLLWQLAYTELYFTPTLWPDFDAAQLDAAIAWYRERERRFGRTRVLTAAVLLAVLLSALFLLPGNGWVAFCALLLGIAAWEWGALAGLAAAGRSIYTAFVIGLFVLPEVLEVSRADGLYAPIWIYCAAALFWIILVPLWMWRRPRMDGRALLLTAGAIAF